MKTCSTAGEPVGLKPYYKHFQVRASLFSFPGKAPEGGKREQISVGVSLLVYRQQIRNDGTREMRENP
jgi:hypothetical protein